MISVSVCEQIVRDLKDILAQSEMTEVLRTALNYNVLQRLQDEIKDHYTDKEDALISYLANAEGVEPEDITLADSVDAETWLDEIEEYSFDYEATSEPAQEVLKLFKERRLITITGYKDEDYDAAGDEE